MVLSALQIIRDDYAGLRMPNCVWLNSAWTQLDVGKCESHIRNKDIDGVVGLKGLTKYGDWAVGKIDGDLNVINDKGCEELRYKYSAINGEFHDLCPMYFGVGATEMLLDDTLECAKKAYNAGNEDVVVEIEPYMLHVYAIRINLFEEALEATKRGCKWLQKYMAQPKLSSKL